MIGFQCSARHSRENGNPDTKNRYHWIPRIKCGQALLEFIPMKIGAGMTDLKNVNLNLRSSKIFQKSQETPAFFPRMCSILATMKQTLDNSSVLSKDVEKLYHKI